MTNSNTIQNIAYTLIIILILGWLSSIGSSILLPIIFASLFAFFLSPVNKFFIKFIKIRSLSILVSFLSVFILFSLVTAIFSVQLINIIDSLPSIGESFKDGIEKVLSTISQKLPFLNLDSNTFFKENASKFLAGPLDALSQGVIISSNILLNIALTFIYTFFILLYKRSIRNFAIFQFEKKSRPRVRETLNEIQETIQAYVGGIGIVMVILTILNTIGLSIIGIKYAFFWGALAGLLAVIPYVGTLLGGLLPFIYALATADATWQPIAVVIYYIIIQQIEGNIITPKIVGDKVDINPLVAIISLMIFGTLWGVGGVILALPIVSIIKIILSQFESTLAIALLMSSDIDSNHTEFKEIA